jgi:hypothetical protein
MVLRSCWFSGEAARQSSGAVAEERRYPRGSVNIPKELCTNCDRYRGLSRPRPFSHWAPKLLSGNGQRHRHGEETGIDFQTILDIELMEIFEARGDQDLAQLEVQIGPPPDCGDAALERSKIRAASAIARDLVIEVAVDLNAEVLRKILYGSIFEVELGPGLGRKRRLEKDD